nr:hypothetical protein Iba_chr06fCG9420 [Ipomoea batatas]
MLRRLIPGRIESNIHMILVNNGQRDLHRLLIYDSRCADDPKAQSLFVAESVTGTDSVSKGANLDPPAPETPFAFPKLVDQHPASPPIEFRQQPQPQHFRRHREPSQTVILQLASPPKEFRQQPQLQHVRCHRSPSQTVILQPQKKQIHPANHRPLLACSYSVQANHSRRRTVENP